MCIVHENKKSNSPLDVWRIVGIGNRHQRHHRQNPPVPSEAVRDYGDGDHGVLEGLEKAHNGVERVRVLDAGDRRDVEKGELLGPADELRRRRGGTVLLLRRVGAAQRGRRRHQVARVQGLGQKGQLGEQDGGEEDGARPLDPGVAGQADEAADQGAGQQARVDGEHPQADLGPALVLVEEVADDGQADVGGGADAQALEEARRHVAGQRRGEGGADGRGQRHRGAEDDDGPPPDAVGRRGKDERAEGQPQRRDGHRPVDLLQGGRVLFLQRGEGRHRHRRDVGEHEVADDQWRG